MLRFFSSLLFSHAPTAGGPDQALIDAAIERAVSGTDRRLSALGDYRQRLRDPVERAVGHVAALVDGLPEPSEISRQAFGLDPRVRAFFSSGEHLREVLGRLADLRGCLEHGAGPAPDGLFGLLAIRELRLPLDYRGVKAAEASPSSPALRLTELYSGIGARRIVFPGRVPRGEIPERPNLLKEAGRYLN